MAFFRERRLAGRSQLAAQRGVFGLEGEKASLGFQSRDDLDKPEGDVLWTRPRGGRRTEVALEPMRYTDRLGSVAEFDRAIDAGDEPSISGRDNIGTLQLVATYAFDPAKANALLDEAGYPKCIFHLINCNDYIIPSSSPRCHHSSTYSNRRRFTCIIFFNPNIPFSWIHIID